MSRPSFMFYVRRETLETPISGDELMLAVWSGAPGLLRIVVVSTLLSL